MHPLSTNDKFVGMADYIMESFHDLLTRDFEMIFDLDSSRGSHHPSRECLIADTPKGHVESIHKREVTPRLTSTMRSGKMRESRLTCR
jgi:hypothetical protein